MRLNIRRLNKIGRARLASKHYEYMEMTQLNEIEESFNNSIIFKGEDKLFIRKPIYETMDIEIVKSGSVETLFDYPIDENSTAILNFASYKYPGGQFLSGSPAQEEALCHSSTLYNVLVRFNNEYYEPHFKTLNHALYTDELLYSPKIQFFDYYMGTDDQDYDEECITKIIPHNRKNVNVITCAAPNAGTYYRYNIEPNKMEVELAMRSRIRLILDTAIRTNNNTLILGAFGCGVFRNDPYVVARIFKDYFDNEYKGMFRKIIFPIPIGKYDNNYEAFSKVFSGEL